MNRRSQVPHIKSRLAFVGVLVVLAALVAGPATAQQLPVAYGEEIAPIVIERQPGRGPSDEGVAPGVVLPPPAQVPTAQVPTAQAPTGPALAQTGIGITAGALLAFALVACGLLALAAAARRSRLVEA